MSRRVLRLRSAALMRFSAIRADFPGPPRKKIRFLPKSPARLSSRLVGIANLPVGTCPRQAVSPGSTIVR